MTTTLDNLVFFSFPTANRDPALFQAMLEVLDLSLALGTGHKVQGGGGWAGKKGGVGHCFHACKKGWASKNHASLKGWGT